MVWTWFKEGCRAQKDGQKNRCERFDVMQCKMITPNAMSKQVRTQRDAKGFPQSAAVAASRSLTDRLRCGGLVRWVVRADGEVSHGD